MVWHVACLYLGAPHHLSGISLSLSLSLPLSLGLSLSLSLSRARALSLCLPLSPSLCLSEHSVHSPMLHTYTYKGT